MAKAKSNRTNNSKEEETQGNDDMENFLKLLGTPKINLAENYLKITQELKKLLVICKVCGEFKTANPDGICDKCKLLNK